MRRAMIVLGALAAMATPVANAKVENSGASGFTIGFEADLPVTASVAFDKWVQIAGWWTDAHTYSGSAKNLTLDATRGGCWCEANGAGFVEHMRVVNVSPGQMIVLHGGLGPLQFMGVAGAMTVSFAPNEANTRVTMRYAVGGYDPDGFARLPALVDGVLAEAFARYTAFAVAP